MNSGTRSTLSEGALIEPSDEDWSRVMLEPRTGKSQAGFDFVVPLSTAEGRTGIGMAMHLVPTTYGTFDIEVEGFVPVAAPVELSTSSKPISVRSRGGASPSQPSSSAVPERWRPVLDEVVHRLAIGDYAGLVADGLVSFTDDPADTSIGRWIEEYPAKLVDLPAEAWDYSEHGASVDAQGSWWVIVDLWTGEGRSDLSMEATVWDDGTSVVAKIDNVHVM